MNRRTDAPVEELVKAPPHPDDDGPPVGPQVIFAVDAECVCTLSTGPGLEALGVRPGQLVGLNLLDVYRDDPQAIESLRRAMAGESFTSESAFHGRVLSVFYQATYDENGRFNGTIGVSTDVTEQRRVEAEIRAARHRETLLADLSAGLNKEVLDLDATLSFTARSAAEAVGDMASVWLADGSGRLRPRAFHGMEPRHAEAWQQQPDTDIPVDEYLQELGAGGEARVIDLGDAHTWDFPGSELATRTVREGGFHSALRLPLRSRGVLIGALDLVRAGNSPPFDEEDVGLATEIAERCALAIDNALLLEAERDAREDLIKFKALADASSDMIAISSPDDRALYVNPAIHEAGVAPDHDELWRILVERLGVETTTLIRDAITTSGRWSGDLELQDPPLVVRADAFTLRHPDTGAVLGNAWMARDVTVLHNAERALREAVADLKRFKALVEASPDFIAIADLDGTVRYVNPPGRTLIGMGDDVDVTATTIADYLTPEGLAASVEVEQPAVVSQGHWEGESTLRNWRGGPPIPVAIASFLMRDQQSGEPFALATVQRDITERLAAETALRDLAEQRQALLTRLVDAQDAERRRIAADVHDDPVQALAAVDLRLGMVRRKVREAVPELLDAFDTLQDSVSGATDRLRALLFDLEPPDVAHGLGEPLRRCADDVFDQTGIAVSIDTSREPAAPEATRGVAYRIAREALINVRKHADARTVRVTVEPLDDGLGMVVSDDGVGLETGDTAPGHRGVSTMADRAAAAGGTCTVSPGADGGTVVRTWLPLH